MLATVDGILRTEGAFEVGRGRVPWSGLVLSLVIGGFAYGAAMGAFGLRPLQIVYSGVKVPLLIGLASLVCLPSFFVINTVLGLRDDFSAAFRGVLAAQATVAIGLAALAPLVAMTYVTSRDYNLAIVMNGAYFAVATLAGQAMLERHYRPLFAANPRHRLARMAWVGLYVFVAIQLAWVLRPFVGSPGMETRFFREGAWSNAYVVVIGDVWKLVTGS